MVRFRRGRDHRVDEAATTAPPLIDALTGVRALAATWVVANHLGEAVYQLFPALRVLEPLTVGGYLGVDVFFVLSGFILSYNYCGRLRADGPSYRRFLTARIARIYPVHLFALLLMVAVVVRSAQRGAPINPGQDRSAANLLGNVLMLQAIPGVTPWNWPSWSVSTELAAYLVFPFVAAAVFRLRRRRALLLAVVVVVAQLAVLTMPMSLEAYTIALMWARIAGEFTVGCLLWAAWRHGARSGLRWDVVAVLSFAAAVAAAWSLPGHPLSWIAVPFLALFVVAVASSAGPVRRIFASRPLRWGGHISYSLYLLHSPVLAAIWLYYPPGAFSSASRLTRAIVVAGWGVALAAAAALTFHLVEQPARRAIRRWGRASSAPAPTTATEASGTPSVR